MERIAEPELDARSEAEERTHLRDRGLVDNRPDLFHAACRPNLKLPHVTQLIQIRHASATTPTVRSHSDTSTDTTHFMRLVETVNAKGMGRRSEVKHAFAAQLPSPTRGRTLRGVFFGHENVTKRVVPSKRRVDAGVGIDQQPGRKTATSDADLLTTTVVNTGRVLEQQIATETQLKQGRNRGLSFLLLFDSRVTRVETLLALTQPIFRRSRPMRFRRDGTVDVGEFLVVPRDQTSCRIVDLDTELLNFCLGFARFTNRIRCRRFRAGNVCRILLIGSRRHRLRWILPSFLGFLRRFLRFRTRLREFHVRRTVLGFGADFVRRGLSLGVRFRKSARNTRTAPFAMLLAIATTMNGDHALSAPLLLFQHLLVFGFREKFPNTVAVAVFEVVLGLVVRERAACVCNGAGTDL